jgi:methionyl aminopeptidase
VLVRKSLEEIQKMKESGRIAALVMKRLVESAAPGTKTLALDQLAEKLIGSFGAKPSFKMVPGYRYATCLTVNEQVVHGLPSGYSLKEGDLLGIDLGVYYQGFHADTAVSLLVGREISEEKKKFLAVGREALEKAIAEAKLGNHIGDISWAIQKTIEGAGYSVVRELVGHGVGRRLHESPQVPGRGEPKTGLALVEGMTLAIEVIYNKGSHQVKILPDGWTIVTSDGQISGLFEHSVAVTKVGPLILTST